EAERRAPLARLGEGARGTAHAETRLRVAAPAYDAQVGAAHARPARVVPLPRLVRRRITIGDPLGDVARQVVDTFGRHARGEAADGGELGEAVGVVRHVPAEAAVVARPHVEQAAPRVAPIFRAARGALELGLRGQARTAER